MNGVLTLLGAAVAVILQSTVLSGWRVGESTPNLPLVLVTVWAIVGGLEAGLIWALLAGLLTDLVSAGPFGASAFALALAAVAAVFIGRSTFTNSTLLPLAAIALATIVYTLALGLAMQVAGWRTPWVPTLTRVVLPSLALNVALIIPLYWSAATISRRRALLVGFR